MRRALRHCREALVRGDVFDPAPFEATVGIKSTVL
jgi:hypothetical protein